MFAIFRHSFSRLVMQILGWGLTFAFFGWLTTWSYDTVMKAQAQVLQLLNVFPREMMSFFGDLGDAFKPSGYLDVMLFSYSAVTLAFFTIIAGSGLIASDEEAGRLDLIQAHPVSRDALFWGRFLSMTLAAVLILALTWAGCAIGQIGTSFPVSIAAMALPNVVSFAVLMLFGAFALLLSMALPSRTMAASLAALVLVASYAITSLARVISSLRGVARFSPLKYYQSGAAVDGLRWDWFLGLLALAALCTLAAWLLYRRRDLRVSGEGNWRLPAWMRGRKL